MKIRRKVLTVTIIELTDEGLCRMANWSPICFADMPTSNKYRRWIVIKVGIPNFVSGPREYIMEGEYVISAMCSWFRIS